MALIFVDGVEYLPTDSMLCALFLACILVWEEVAGTCAAFPRPPKFVHSKADDAAAPKPKKESSRRQPFGDNIIICHVPLFPDLFIALEASARPSASMTMATVGGSIS
jgi:hypothetical protein